MGTCKVVVVDVLLCPCVHFSPFFYFTGSYINKCRLVTFHHSFCDLKAMLELIQH